MAENNDKMEVQNEEAEAALRKIGDYINGMVPAGMGFSLLLFDFGDGGNMFYLSSAQREDMLKAMKEFISKQEPTEE